MPAQWKIGIIVDCLGLAPREGIRKCRELAVDGFQIYVTKGEMHPDNLSPAARRELKRFVGDLGLEISALCADFDWVRGFTDPAFNKVNVPRLKRCVDLACDLDTRVVTMHIGKLPEDHSHPTYREVLCTATELAEYAASRGAVLCTETGPEAPESLLAFLKQCPAEGIGVNYDPANLVMCGPFDHIGGVGILKKYIHHTHAKDGVCLGCGHWEELPLGRGGVVFPHYLAALKAAAYTGYLTVEREAGDDRIGDITQAVRFLRQLIEAGLPALPQPSS